MTLVHLQTPQISKYIFFENSDLNVVHNEFIVFQKSLKIGKDSLKDFIKSIIPSDQFQYIKIKEDPLDFHGDIIDKDKNIQLDLEKEFKDKLDLSFTIENLYTYTFYGVGIDIYTGDTFTRPKKDKDGEEVEGKVVTKKRSYGNYGNIEVKYRCPDYSDPNNPKKGRMIILNFHINCDNTITIVDSKTHFTTELEKMYGKKENSFIKEKAEYIKKLTDMNIFNFKSISNEPMVSMDPEKSKENFKFICTNNFNWAYFKIEIEKHINGDFKEITTNLNTYTFSKISYLFENEKKYIITLEYRYTPKELDTSNGDKTATLKFEIRLLDRCSDLSRSLKDFTTYLPKMLNELDNNQIHTFRISTESVDTILESYKELKEYKENVETKKTEMLKFFDEKKKKANNILTFQCNDEEITEEQVREEFSGCRIL